MLGLNHKLSHAFRAWVVFDRLRLHNVVVTRYAQVHTVITVLNTEHHNWNTPKRTQDSRSFDRQHCDSGTHPATQSRWSLSTPFSTRLELTGLTAPRSERPDSCDVYAPASIMPRARNAVGKTAATLDMGNGNKGNSN